MGFLYRNFSHGLIRFTFRSSSKAVVAEDTAVVVDGPQVVVVAVADGPQVAVVDGIKLYAFHKQKKKHRQNIEDQ